MATKDHKPTMKDVAKLAGVSYQTVSCVVNNIPVVKEETRQRVLEAIQTLNYTPDAAARSLRSGQTNILGLMIPDAHNPFFWQIVTGAENEALEHGYSLLLSTTSMNREREARAFRTLLKERLDGIIPLFTYPEDFVADLKALQARKFPFVLFGSSLKLPEVDVVRTHFETSARELMEHLLDLGHRRIAIICGVGRVGLAKDRVKVYHEYLEKAGIAFNPEWTVTTGNTLHDGYDAAQHLLRLTPTPTAIIGINDLMAFGAMQAALQHGLRVPEDISIAGFDDVEMSALLSPPMTTGQADGVEIGRQLVRLVLQRLKNPDLPGERVHLPTRLIIRHSTGPACIP